MLPKNEHEAFGIGFLSNRRRLTSRLAERGEGSFEFIQHWIAPDQCPVTEQEILDALHRLEARGLVRREIQVNPYDSAEYFVVWSLAAPEHGKARSNA